MRTHWFCCIALAALVPHPAGAAENEDYLQFYPPFFVEDIARQVQQRQDELAVAQFHSSLTVQYGTRIEWINACAWLEAQTEDVMRFYLPPQNGSDEYFYFCSLSKTYDRASVDSLSDVQALASELTRQFGGAVTRWIFNFRQPSEREDFAYIGVTIAKVSPDICAELADAGDCSRAGAMVVDVTGEPARAAGLKKGDILVRLNDRAISEPTEVVEVVRHASPGDPFYATVLRGRQEIEISGVLGTLE